MKFKFDKSSLKKILISFVIIVIGIVLDQITKIIFQNLAQKGELPITVLPGIVDFNFALNTGAAWGSFNGNNVLFFVLTIIALPVFAFVLLFRLDKGMVGTLGFAFILSGAIGNAIDRGFLGDGFYNGAVRDFIETRFLGNMNFICNVADILLTAGVIMVVVGMLFTDTDAIFKKQVDQIEKNSQIEYTTEDFLETTVQNSAEADEGLIIDLLEDTDDIES